MEINKKQIYRITRAIIPAAIFLKFRNSSFYNQLSALFDRLTIKPKWNEVTSGVLKGSKVFIDPKGAWKEMVSGEYDQFFFDYLKKFNLEGKVVYDVGAHIGYSSMSFAKLVGPTGKVFAFEPNIFNRERFELILRENKTIADVVKIFDVAISDKIGEEDFVFSNNVDNSKSSGSFIESADTFFEKSFYEKNIGFKRIKTKTVPLDRLDTVGILAKPALIKIDIEGAEYLALNGGLETLSKYRPILLIEIHSIFNMLKVSEILNKLNYKVELLKEEKDGRCFIAATV